jgi:hypothetical protein
VAFSHLRFAPPTVPATAQQTGVEAAKATSPPSRRYLDRGTALREPVGGRGLEFFSDGITEEITSRSRFPICAWWRTSAYQFKGWKGCASSAALKRRIDQGSVRKKATVAHHGAAHRGRWRCACGPRTTAS